MKRRIALAAALVAAFVAGVIGAQADPSGQTVPHINHVFIIVLENENADSTFGPETEIPYLAKTMTSEGAYIPNYYATGHLSLDNYISMVSGLGPNVETQADCEVFTNFVPGTPVVPPGQYVGQGCVYPPGVQNIATQLEGNGYTWKGYMQDMANSAPEEPATCRHPAINGQDHTQSARPDDQYAARHNPFVYFHSIIDFPTCDENDVDLSLLETDLEDKDTTPDYAFISPDLCNDGHDEPCVDGQPGGMVQANSFLEEWVPRITSSAAFKDDGLLLVTFDEAEGDPRETQPDASACCDEQPGPNTINPGGPIPGPGGGKIGAVLLSPCITPGTVSDDAYNHYSLLRWVEDNFALPRLGFARQATGVNSFDAEVLSDADCEPGGEGTTTSTTGSTTTTTTTTTATTTTGTTTSTPIETTGAPGAPTGVVPQGTKRKKCKKKGKVFKRGKCRRRHRK